MLKHIARSLAAVCVALVAAWVEAGCGAAPDASRDVAARYHLEKAIWTAEQLRKRAVSDPLRERHEDLRAAAAIYDRLLGAERFRGPVGPAASTPAARDLQKLLLGCKIARAELYFVELEDYAGVTYLGSIGDPHDLLFSRHYGLRLTRVKALYGTGAGNSLEVRCARAYGALTDDPLLWIGGQRMGDTLLAGPAALARIQTDRESLRTFDHCRNAEDFYTRIIDTRPEDPVSDRARVHRAEVYASEGRFEEALRDVDGALQRARTGDRREELLLWKGEMLVYGLHRDDEGHRVLRGVTEESPRTSAARRARLIMAEIEASRGRHEDAVRMLRELELDPATPRATVAAAMFLRALQLDRRGDWPEAAQLLRQVCRLEPSTLAAAVSPLVIIAHDVRARDSATVEKTLREAAEIYDGAIAKTAGNEKLSHVLTDFLIEGYLVAEEPTAAAELLGSRAPARRGDKGCVGLYKSGLIYLKLVNDQEKGVGTLQKCLDVFPASRYAWVVREELDRISPTGDTP